MVDLQCVVKACVGVWGVQACGVCGSVGSAGVWGVWECGECGRVGCVGEPDVGVIVIENYNCHFQLQLCN